MSSVPPKKTAMPPTTAKLIVTSSKESVPKYLNGAIVSIANESLTDHDSFTIALSGGSLPTFLTSLADAFVTANVDPQWSKWHLLLADERCVPLDDDESNLGAIQKYFIQYTTILPDHVYGINQELVQSLATSSSSSTTAQIATEYETTVRSVLNGYSGGRLDLAVLGFGPDGHTCSLFPGHPLLDEHSLLVAPINDSPKPPPQRITLTYPVLNDMTRHVIVCGAGSSKRQVIQTVFPHPLDGNATTDDDNKLGDATATVYPHATMATPPPYPSAMVKPLETLTWLIDADAIMDG